MGLCCITMQIGVFDVGHSKKSLKNAVLQYSQTSQLLKTE